MIPPRPAARPRVPRSRRAAVLSTALLLLLLCLTACGAYVPPQAGAGDARDTGTASAAGTGAARDTGTASAGGTGDAQDTAQDTGTAQAGGTVAAQDSGKEDTEPPPEEPKYLPETSPEKAEKPSRTEAELRALLSGMSREQKVGQLFFIDCEAADMDGQIARYHPGGVLLFTKDFQDAGGAWLSREAVTAKLGAMQASAKEHGGIGLFIGSDEEGGTVTRASRDPYLFPARSLSPQVLYQRGGLDAILSDAAEKSWLLRDIGINVNFAPVCDVAAGSDDWIWPRTLGRGAEETAEYAAAVTRVMLDSGIAPVLKHFPGYGSTGDTHRLAAEDDRPIESFRASDWLPFEAGIRAGAPFVLVSHVTVLCLDPDLPASLSPAAHEKLRKELGFGGIIVTDDLDMGALGGITTEGAAVLAVQAGNDMLTTSAHETQIPAILEALEAGTIDEAAIDEACLRILRVKAALKMI